MEEYLKKHYGGSSARKVRRRKDKASTTSLLIINDNDIDDLPTIEEPPVVVSAAPKTKWVKIDASSSSSSSSDDESTRKRRRRSSTPPDTEAGRLPEYGLLKDPAKYSSNTKAELVVELNGKFAETVHRDKFGKVIDVKQAAALEAAKTQAKLPRQSIGLQLAKAQTRQAEDRKLADASARPFAIYRDDAILNAEQKSKSRDGDPLSMREATGKIQVYKGYCTPNRFAGYRWDGVDRSNGYETTAFHKQSEASIVKDAAYKWSTEDM